MASSSRDYTLYHHPFSVCSIMVRYAFALRGAPAAGDAIRLHEREVDILHGAQLTEPFLCEVNGHGEVPVLVPDAGAPLPDSVAITYRLARAYPAMVPTAVQTDVERLLAALHGINFFALTFTHHPQTQQHNRAFLRQQLAGDISERYRRAIHHKLERLETTKLGALAADRVQAAVDRATAFTAEIEQLLRKSETGWVLGTPQPTALDAHLVVFLARMHDVHRDDLIPDTVKAYAAVAMAQPAFQATMQGRRTMPPAWFD